MIFRIIIFAILIAFVLRFVLRFVLPIFQITRMTQDKLRDMQKQMEDMQQPNAGPSAARQQPHVREGDYIEYEEVK